MKGKFFAIIAGYLFAWGLGISGMTKPSKVLGFLDVFGAWDPALAFVMIAAVSVSALLYRLSLKLHKPVCAEKFNIPTHRRIDARLVMGAALFGVGWGLAGYCPGPALLTLTTGNLGVVVFVGAMITGIPVYPMFEQLLASSGSRAESKEGRPVEHQSLFDPPTSTLTYVVHDPKTNDAVAIDPVLDFDPAGGTTSLKALEPVLAFLKENHLTLRMILETHAHADHLSGSQALKERFPDAVLAIGEAITRVQAMFREVFDFPPSFTADGSQFDRLLKDGESVRAGSIGFQVLFTPGHTPACASYLFGDAVFTGDALFMPDSERGAAISRAAMRGTSISPSPRNSMLWRMQRASSPATTIFLGADRCGTKVPSAKRSAETSSSRLKP